MDQGWNPDAKLGLGVLRGYVSSAELPDFEFLALQ